MPSNRPIKKLLLNRARERAKRNGVPFDIDESDISVPIYCPVLGLRLKQGDIHFKRSSPSLDRIDPSKGYVKGNVRVISMRANLLKSNAASRELALVLRDLRRLEDEVKDKKRMAEQLELRLTA